MKTSYIVFASTVALLLLVVGMPQLLGLIKLDKNDKPMDFMSEFWAEHFSKDRGSHDLANFHHIQLEGKAESVTMDVIKSKTGVAKVWVPSQKNVKFEVKNDTLYVKSLNRKNYKYISLEVTQPLQQVLFKDVNIHASFAEDLMNDMHIRVVEGSDFSLMPINRLEGDTALRVVPKVQISVSGKSRAFLANYHIGQIRANLQEGLLRYSHNLHVDTINVKLAGKSAVSSTHANEVNKVGLLRISGDKDYFRQDNIGQDVRLEIDN